MTVFVSGATGFIGSAVLRALTAAGIPALGGSRQQAMLPDGVTPVVTGDLASASLDLSGVEAVVHTAGLAHVRRAPPGAWQAANVQAAINLAEAAQNSGVKRFILISSVGVNGRAVDGVVTEGSPVNPADDYARSKLDAEREAARILGPKLSIIRPVAVIGPGCPGNLPLLMKLLAMGIPLPFGSIANRRSFIDVADLARLVLAVLGAPAPPALMIAAHPEPVSTPELIRALAAGLARPARLLPCPPALLAAATKTAGRAAMWQSLAGSFVAAPAAALSLGWAPRQSINESLAETARYYNTTRSHA